MRSSAPPPPPYYYQGRGGSRPASGSSSSSTLLIVFGILFAIVCPGAIFMIMYGVPWMLEGLNGGIEPKLVLKEYAPKNTVAVSIYDSVRYLNEANDSSDQQRIWGRMKGQPYEDLDTSCSFLMYTTNDRGEHLEFGVLTLAVSTNSKVLDRFTRETDASSTTKYPIYSQGDRYFSLIAPGLVVSCFSKDQLAQYIKDFEAKNVGTSFTFDDSYALSVQSQVDWVESKKFLEQLHPEAAGQLDNVPNWVANIRRIKIESGGLNHMQDVRFTLQCAAPSDAQEGEAWIKNNISTLFQRRYQSWKSSDDGTNWNRVDAALNSIYKYSYFSDSEKIVLDCVLNADEVPLEYALRRLGAGAGFPGEFFEIDVKSDARRNGKLPADTLPIPFVKGLGELTEGEKLSKRVQERLAETRANLEERREQSQASRSGTIKFRIVNFSTGYEAKIVVLTWLMRLQLDTGLEDGLVKDAIQPGDSVIILEIDTKVGIKERLEALKIGTIEASSEADYAFDWNLQKKPIPWPTVEPTLDPIPASKELLNDIDQSLAGVELAPREIQEILRVLKKSRGPFSDAGPALQRLTAAAPSKEPRQRKLVLQGLENYIHHRASWRDAAQAFDAYIVWVDQEHLPNLISLGKQADNWTIQDRVGSLSRCFARFEHFEGLYAMALYLKTDSPFVSKDPFLEVMAILGSRGQLCVIPLLLSPKRHSSFDKVSEFDYFRKYGTAASAPHIKNVLLGTIQGNPEFIFDKRDALIHLVRLCEIYVRVQSRRDPEDLIKSGSSSGSETEGQLGTSAKKESPSNTEESDETEN